MAFQLGKNDSKAKRLIRQENAKEVMLLARDCLNADQFKRYKIKALAVTKEIDEALDEYQNDNPVEYGFKVRELLTMRRLIRTLLKDVEEEAKVGVEIKEEKKEE